MPKAYRVLLEGHSITDVPEIHRWLNDADIQNLSSDSPRVEAPDQVYARVQRWLTSDPNEIEHFGLRLTESRQLIGYAHVAHIDTYNGTCKIGFVIGEKDLWGRGLGREMLDHLLDHIFNTRHLRRVSAEAYNFNMRANRLLRGAAFTLEGVLRQSVRRGADFADENVYGLLASEWQRGG